jgi:hypothetical protein
MSYWLQAVVAVVVQSVAVAAQAASITLQVNLSTAIKL